MTHAAQPPTHLSPRDLPSVIVRPLEQADLAALEWGGEYAHFRRLYADIYAAGSQGRAALWVAEALGFGVVGQLFVQLTSARRELADGFSRGYIYGFRIQPAFRNLGIGTTMLQVAEDDLRGRRYRWVTLNVGVDNPDARRLYERLGYTMVASEPGIWSYYDEAGVRREVHEPAWRMEKRLAPG